MFAGTCPGCKEKNTQVRFKGVTATQWMGTNQLLCVSYVCGKCDTILGVQADPIALMTDQTNRIAKRLGKSS